MNEHEKALAELDGIGRHAGAALRIAAQRSTTNQATPAASGAPVADTAVDPVEVDLRPVVERAPRRRRRLLLIAAAVLALGGIVAGLVIRNDGTPPTSTTVGAPTAVLGDDPGGIYPPDAPDRGYTVASPEGTVIWDQWTLDLPPVGQHLLLTLDSRDTRVTAVMDDLGATPLQVATLSAGAYLPGAKELAVYGVVDASAESLTVERPGAAPVGLYVDPVEGATHDLFVGFLPVDVGDDATVVARDADGREVGRVALPAPEDDSGDPEGSLFPGDPDHVDVAFGRDGDAEPWWGVCVLDGGRYALLQVEGNEDSASTVIERPGSEDLQALATRLDGRPGPGETVIVYGLVRADATNVELTAPGMDPVPLPLSAIEGATHSAFAGWAPDVPDDAVVVARDAQGREIERRPLAWTVLDAAGS